MNSNPRLFVLYLKCPALRMRYHLFLTDSLNTRRESVLFNVFNLRVSVFGRVFPISISGINGLSISSTAFTLDFSIENMELGLYVSMSSLSGSTLIPIRSPKPHLLSLCERSEEHTSELQSRLHLVCRLLL